MIQRKGRKVLRKGTQRKDFLRDLCGILRALCVKMLFSPMAPMLAYARMTPENALTS